MDPVVILGSESVSVGPGQEQRLPVRIRNQGRRVESFRVDVVGAPEAFSEVVPRVVSVLPGREAEIDVIFRPPGGASTPTGTLPFAVRATSEVDASSSAVGEGRLELAGVAGLQAWAPETSRAGRWSARYHVEFANQGNAAVRLALTAHDPAGVTKLRLSPDAVDLPPGGRAIAELKATTRRPFLRGSKVNRNLQVACQTFPFGGERPAPGAPPPQGDPNNRTFQLTFEQRPILPKFAIPLLVLALAVLIALAVVKLRRGEEFSLDLAAPLSPTGVEAIAAGDSSIGLRWIDVPNAEGYEVRQVSVAGIAADDVLEAVPPDQNTYEAKELLAATTHCFVVKALGPEDRASALSDEACATTGAPTDLPLPTDVSATPEGGDRYLVAWTYPAEFEGVQFIVFVGGAPKVGPLPGLSVTIELPMDDAEQVARIQVQAVRGDDLSGLSVEFLLPIAALPPETVPPTPPPTESPATTLPPETTVAPTTVPGGQTTDTGPPSTEPSPTAEALQNLPPTWAAVFVGSVPQGGETLDARKDRLAGLYSIPVDELDVFSTRDTAVRDPDDSPSLLAQASPVTRFVYFGTVDQAAAEEVCARVPETTTCRVAHLTGAARASEGTPILFLERLDTRVTMTALDERLITLRGVDALDSDDVHVLNGSTYPQFRTTSPVVFVSDPTIFGDVEAFCAAEEMTCNLELLQSSG